MYYPSRYNHLVQVEPEPGTKKWVITNLFFGAVTLLNEAAGERFLAGERAGQMSDDCLSHDAWQHFLDRGFVWPGPDAEAALIERSADTLGNRDQIAAGLAGGHYGFITSLHCNLACPYCFQRGKPDSIGFLTPRQVDLGLAAIAEAEQRVASLQAGKTGTPKISVTGGEPLLRNRPNLTVLHYLLDRLADLGWPYSITTNGTELSKFVAERKPAPNCRNIQVTLDGPRSIHDTRRYYRGGASSFENICEGLEDALAAGWRMNLRVNVDLTNVDNLPELAEFVQQRGWPEHENFHAYVSPVTDHGSLGGYATPKDEADLLVALLEVIDRTAIVRQVFDIRHFRGFNYVERVLLQQDPSYPVVYRCEAVMGMYIFDPAGDVHVCLEAVGDPGLRVGTYDPEWQLDNDAVARWTRRNVMAMPQCSTCKIRFICAGGCAFESFSKGTATPCMPFLSEMTMAWQYYAKSRPELFAD